MLPRGVPEASRRRPRVSKNRPEGAKVDLVVFYNSKWDPEGIPEASRASKMSPNASQRRPEDAQECQRSDQEAQLDLVVFYSVFKRLYSSKWDPEGIPEASRASKMSPNASQRRPEDAQECQRSDQEAQSSILSCFIVFSSDPGPGGSRAGTASKR